MSAEARLNEAKQHTIAASAALADLGREITDLRTRLQTAEQQLGQVREELATAKLATEFACNEVEIRNQTIETLQSQISTPSDGCGKGRVDGKRDKKELARVEAQSKEEAFAEMSANGVDVAAFKERVNQIVDDGVTKHSIYCKITRSDGSVHMLPDPAKVGDVEWQLRYGSPDSVRWLAASVIGFYRTFFSLPYKSRLEVMSKILAASSIGKEGGR